MVKLENLSSLEKNGERKVRDSIKTPNGEILVYEATLDNMEDIIALTQEVAGNDFDTGQVYFNEQLVLDKLMPMLTNIDVQHLTVEQRQEILDNPSTHLLTALQVVGQIVCEANRLYVEQMTTRLSHVANSTAQKRMLEELPSILESAVMGSDNEDMKESLGNIVRIQDELNKRIKDGEEVNADNFEPMMKDIDTKFKQEKKELGQ